MFLFTQRSHRILRNFSFYYYWLVFQILMKQGLDLWISIFFFQLIVRLFLINQILMIGSRCSSHWGGTRIYSGDRGIRDASEKSVFFIIFIFIIQFFFERRNFDWIRLISSRIGKIFRIFNTKCSAACFFGRNGFFTIIPCSKSLQIIQIFLFTLSIPPSWS